MRALILALSAAVITFTSASGVEVQSLPSGKPAGIRTSQSETSRNVLIGLGAGLSGLAIALIASNGKAGGVASTTSPITTSTGTGP